MDRIGSEEESFAPIGFSASMVLDDFIPFPPFSRRKEHMEIKDVARDHILRFLPAKTLFRFRSVSKDWDYQIRSPFLAHQQSYSFQGFSGYFVQSENYDPPFLTLDRTTYITLDNAAYGVPMPGLGFLPELVDIRSSSNGLLLCQGYTENNRYYICNPANKEWSELPEPIYHHGYKSAAVLIFEPSVLNIEAHYTIICAVSFHGEPIVGFELYSSETKSWRSSGAICLQMENSEFVGNGIYLNGIVYWLTSASKVLAFDVNHDIYSTISLPNGSPSGGVLTKIGDEVGYIGMYNYLSNMCCLQIYGCTSVGADLSLTRRFNVHLEPEGQGISGYRILPSLDSDVVMILLSGGSIHSYNLRTGRKDIVGRVEGVDDLRTARFLPYVNSLVNVA